MRNAKGLIPLRVLKKDDLFTCVQCDFMHSAFHHIAGGNRMVIKCRKMSEMDIIQTFI